MPDDHRAPDNAGVIAPPPLIFGVPLLAGLLANRKFRLGFLPEGSRKPLGVPLLSGGLLLAVWFWLAMWRADTPLDPGKPVRNLATEGPFAYTRNPDYLSMALIYSGVTISKDSLPSAALFPFVLGVIQKGVIEREERYLEERFGEEYRRYAERVGRWI